MRTLLALLVVFLIGASAQIPNLGEHEFAPLTVSIVAGDSFPVDARVVSRNYTVQNPFPGVLRAIGYRLAVANSSTAVGVAFDVVVGAVSTLFDAAIGVGYYGFRAGAAVNPSNGNVAVGFAEAAWAFVTRFFYIAEWNDANNNNQLDVATEVIGGYDLASVATQWNPIQYGRLTSNSVPYYYAQAETSDGVFGFRVVGSGGYIQATEGTTTVKLNPTSLKISISIRYYNNSLNTPRLLVSTGPSNPTTYPNAKLALVTGFGAAAGARGFGVKTNVAQTGSVDFNGNAAQNIQVTGAGNVAGFSWEGATVTRDANGVLVAAGAAGAAVVSAVSDDLSVPNVTNSFKDRFGAGAYAGFALAKVGVYSFAEPRPVSIVWDPTVSTTDSPAAVIVPMLALLFAALLVVLF